jgi:hypothetical protein
LMKVANPSSQDRTPRRAIGLAPSPAAAPYRASGLVLWHFSDMLRSDLSPSYEPKRTLAGRSKFYGLTPWYPGIVIARRQPKKPES